MSVKENILEFNKQLEGSNCKLIAVSKTKPVELIREAHEAGRWLGDDPLGIFDLSKQHGPNWRKMDGLSWGHLDQQCGT